jgi:hypothetical protein
MQAVFIPGEFMQVLRRIGRRPVVLAVALVGVFTMAGCSSGTSSSSGTNTTATPAFTPGAGSYNTTQTVTIADTTAGAVLYCTTDGTTPTTSSPRCSQPSTIFKTEFLQAIAVAPNMAPSAVASAGYTIDLNAAATPTFSPAGGTYTAAQTVTIADTTTGANIYYTTDGSVPTASSTLYPTGHPIAVSTTQTLSAIAVATGFNNSGVASAAYTIGQGTATPVISPAGGTFTAAQSVTITDATSGASIYYTIDGSTPTASSTKYAGAITVSATQTINAIAIASGNISSVATAGFTVSNSAAAPPTFSPAAGSYTSAQAVMLSDATAGATIFYTVDGSMPTTSSPQYSGSINVAASETIKAIATAPGFGPSAVSSAPYTINGSVATPTFSPAAGSYTSTQTVTLSDATAGATIYYTTDGTSATTSSTVYGGTPITVSATETINAIAAAGGATSPMAMAAYTINSAPTFSGTVFSGTLPVIGAQVQMYAAGQTDYASSATPLLTTAATTDASGAFTFTYSCPASPGDLVYLVATGGNTGSGGSNANLALMTALGPCGSLTSTSKFVVNEATTVASAYALSQFMTGATNVGAAAANYQGLTNAFKVVNNLVDATTGTVRDHTPDYSTNLAGDPMILNNSTVPQARINTLANILNACAATGSGCSSLFSAATPGSGTAPADTLQAILNIAQNPGNQASTVFNVAPTGPYTPVLSGAPNDWTLALTFTGAGLGSAPGTQILFADGSGSVGQLVNSALAIDATGNVWVTAFNDYVTLNGNASADKSGSMIAEFSNLGAPITRVTSLNSSTPAVPTFGGYIPVKRGQGDAGSLGAHSIAFDISGNGWVLGGDPASGVNGDPGAGLLEFNPSSLSVVQPYLALRAGGSTVTDFGASPIVFDGLGNLWAAGFDTLYQFNSSTGAMISSDAGSNPPGSPSGYGVNQSLVFDSNGSYLWSSDGQFGDIYQTNPSTNNAVFDYFPGTSGPTSGSYTPLVAGASNLDGSAGNIYGCASASARGELISFNVGATPALGAYSTYAIPSLRGCGSQMVMDGGGHIFTVTGGTAPGIIDEFTVPATGSSVTMISPTTTGYTGTGTGESPTINPDSSAPATYIVNLAQGVTPAKTNGITGAAIDGSGNLWVLNVDTGATTSPGNVLVEFIGIAAPVVTPTSLALQFGQVGVRP